MSAGLPRDPWAALLDDPAICEVGGEHTNEGIDYAKFLAMALLVEMEKGDLPDYALVFEYLQDIALVDSAVAPTKATLIQVKKRTRGQWSKAMLCRKELGSAVDEDEASTEAHANVAGAEAPPSEKCAPLKTKKRNGKLGAKSPLGKLYLCVDKLSNVVEAEGVFISNAGNDLKGASGSPVPAYSRAAIQHLHVEDVEYIRRKLTSELKQPSLDHLAKLAVEQSSVVPASMRETVRGLLDKLLTEKYPTLPSVSGQLQEKLLAAFSACSGPSGSLSSLKEVLMKKGFTRTAFSSLVEQFAATRTAAGHLDVVIDGLKVEGMPARAADRLRSEASRLQIQMVREPQTREILLWDVAVDAAVRCADLEKYISALNEITAELQAQVNARAHGPTSDREARAIALLAIIHVDQEPTSSSSKSPGQIQ